MKIGLFDSGIGGLTVLKEVMKTYPNNHYIYVGDTKNLPYGEKTSEELKILSEKIIDFLNTKKVDMIIIACGTVSSSIGDYLKSKYTNVVDVISFTIKYVNENFKNIGLMATTRTIDSNVFQEKITISLKVIKTPLLVPMIEKRQIDEKIISNYVQELNECDAIILGCTHYPIIAKYINKKTVNMGTVLAKYLKLTNESEFKLDLYFSKIDNEIEKNVEEILDNKYSLNFIEL